MNIERFRNSLAHFNHLFRFTRPRIHVEKLSISCAPSAAMPTTRYPALHLKTVLLFLRNGRCHFQQVCLLLRTENRANIVHIRSQTSRRHNRLFCTSFRLIRNNYPYTQRHQAVALQRLAHARKLLANVLGEFTLSHRQRAEQILQRDCGTNLASAWRPLHKAATMIELQFAGNRIGHVTRRNDHIGQRAQRTERLTAKAKRCHRFQIGEFANFRRVIFSGCGISHFGQKFCNSMYAVKRQSYSAHQSSIRLRRFHYR